MRRWGVAVALAAVSAVAGCGRPEVRVVGPDVMAVVDVADVLGDTGGVRYGYRWEAGDEWIGETRDVVVEGWLDLERELGTEVRTTTIEAPATEGSVDEHPTTITLVDEVITRPESSFVRREGVDDAWRRVDDGMVPGAHRGLPALLDRLASVETYTVLGVESIGRGATARHLRSVGADDAGDTVDIWIDAAGRLRRIVTASGDRVDLWDHGSRASTAEPSPVDDEADGPVLDDVDYGEVTGAWAIEAQGEAAGTAWRIVGAPGRRGQVDVPCRLLLVAGDVGWDDAEAATEAGAWPTCGSGGYGLVGAVADPAVQVLLSESIWTGGVLDDVLVGLAVSPRFAARPAVLVGQDGVEVVVPLDATGHGVATLPPDLWVESVALDDGRVTCELGPGEYAEESSRPAELLYGAGTTCREA